MGTYQINNVWDDYLCYKDDYFLKASLNSKIPTVIKLKFNLQILNTAHFFHDCFFTSLKN